MIAPERTAGAGRRPRLLISVMTVAEARLAVAAGADIVDAKDATVGALGALPIATVAAIRAAVPAHMTVSATVGDLPAAPDVVCPAVVAMAGTGVDHVKIGIFPGGDARATIAALGRLDLATPLGRPTLVGLLLADRAPDVGLVPAMAAAGFAGVMLDTADKTGRSMPDVLDVATRAAFLATARRHGLFTGLAGSLRVCHVAALAQAGADVLGFRGAACDGGRWGRLSATAVRALAATIDEQAHGRVLP
jgi:uncharacterized protein (UPF0264 family)